MVTRSGTSYSSTPTGTAPEGYTWGIVYSYPGQPTQYGWVPTSTSTSPSRTPTSGDDTGGDGTGNGTGGDGTGGDDTGGDGTGDTGGGGTGTTVPGPADLTDVTQIIPGTVPTNEDGTPVAGLVNVADYGGQITHDPQLAFSNEMLLSGQTPEFSQEQIDAGTVGTDISGIQPDSFSGTAQTGTVTTADQVDPRDAASYEAQQTQDAVAAEDMTAATGQLSTGAQIDSDTLQIDTEAVAAGDTPLGAALDDFAFLDPDNVDARATLLGQIELLQDQFMNDAGEPVIPSWASGIARNVQKIAAFQGITGTAATAAMSQALLESSIEIAKQDAAFYQTLTLTNLNNEQQATIQKASVLAQLDMANLDARTVAAVQNSKNFLAMDLANLSNEQQAAVLNTQNRVQSILEDAKAVNTARLFEAQSVNEMAKFYDQLSAQIEQFNTAQTNAMEQFNVESVNSMTQFNSALEDNRERFYNQMQYNIDLANAQWRQTIATTETQMEFDAAAFDTKNMVDISQEQLNRLWDRADSLLDYVWQSTENELDRDRAITVAQIAAKAQIESVELNQPGFLDILGNIAGALLGNLF